MANALGIYDPLFYANEALIQLENALGMAARVHRGFDEERRSFGLGSKIEIRRPSTFVAQDAPSSAQDVSTGTVEIELSSWKEVKFKLTDKELAYTGDRIISDHIRPAAYALADKVDQDLCNLALDVGQNVAYAGTIADISNAKQKLFDAGVPLMDYASNHYMIDGTAQNAYEQIQAFSQYQGAGDLGVETQLRGQLGMRYGFNIFANQNVATSNIATPTDGAGAAVGAYARGATSITIDGLGATETFYRGSQLVFAGHSGQYTIAADTTASGGSVTVTLTGPLQAAVADNEVATFTTLGTVLAENLMFHKNFAALAFAPLSEMGNELGASIATVQDPKSGLAIRSRLYYVGNSSEVHVALDVLYGVKTLDGNLACRVIRT